MTDSLRLAPLEKFSDPDVTAKGERRARVALAALRTLWINTGSLCNITCRNCYIESSPDNDRLAYITRAEAAAYLDEIEHGQWPVLDLIQICGSLGAGHVGEAIVLGARFDVAIAAGDVAEAAGVDP